MPRRLWLLPAGIGGFVVVAGLAHRSVNLLQLLLKGLREFQRRRQIVDATVDHIVMNQFSGLR